MKTMRGWAAIALTASFVGVWGCDNGAPPVSTSTEEAPVHGTVKLHGKPLASGEVQFDGNNVSRKGVGLRSLKIVDGKYEGKSLVGGNLVSFRSEAFAKDRGAAGVSKEVDVKTGDNTFDFELP
ncbi:hypothetical protein [Paludisphaera rhizosphaerae]|uniref:hypothetical protein n=1 Tax=Paludisphaera rhizosphaerae TaxID=2711216 RepID=UPI0013EC98E4|nr:hypothetical protein [Paludisphaera rhizosphaerae]